MSRRWAPSATSEFTTCVAVVEAAQPQGACEQRPRLGDRQTLCRNTSRRHPAQVIDRALFFHTDNRSSRTTQARTGKRSISLALSLSLPRPSPEKEMAALRPDSEVIGPGFATSSHGARALKPRSALNYSGFSTIDADAENAGDRTQGHSLGNVGLEWRRYLGDGQPSVTRFGQSKHLPLRPLLFAVVWHSTRVPKKRDEASPGNRELTQPEF